jgi:integrase
MDEQIFVQHNGRRHSGSEANMSVRKRQWKTATGELKTAFVVDYFSGGKRRHETFTTQGDAKKRAAQVTLEKANGTHVAIDGKTTVEAAAKKWLEYLRGEGRERSTIEQYRGHLERHILPVLGRKHIRKLDTDTLESFRAFLLNALDDDGKPVRTRAQAAKIWITLKSLLKHSRLGHIGQGVKSITIDSRTKRNLEIGIDVPTSDEIARLYAATAGADPLAKRKRALLLVAAFCGLRASELRGLRWEDVKFEGEAGELQITQRADRYNVIGNPKTRSSQRTVPLPEDVALALKEWCLAQRGSPELVFETVRGGGTIESHGNMLRSLKPVMRAAGLVTKGGKSRYALHAFRHYFASWCISPKERGGRGLSPKVVQGGWLGHSTIAMTLDVYGHLFREIDKDEVSASTKSVLSLGAAQL